ncbi:MAG: T9SS type A sorting domain-containing protein [Ignavibacteria bacterium]|nr:MAG: T9SS type A sorting domain-containing protein [Ignavibacteria bacterium]
MHRSVPFCFILILAGLFVIPAVTLSSPPILPPTISPIANQVTQRDSILGPIAFTVGDPLISPDSLTLSGSSSDTILIPIPNITFGGGGANRTVTIAPGLHRTGTDSIIITVSNGVLTASDTFTVKVNSPPFLDYNVPLDILEDGLGTITTSLLHAIDTDNPPDQVTYTIGPDSSSGQLAMHGAVLLNKAPLTWGGTFTQDDINNNRVKFKQDGSETTSDFFTFGVRDADGGISSDNGFTLFHFNISTTDIHDPPVAYDTTYLLGLGATLKARFPGISPDSSIRIFSIVANGKLGTATLDSISTGDFTYVPDSGITGTDSIIFQVYDGALYAVNPGKVTVTIAQFPPNVINGHAVTPEDSSFEDTLHARDPNVPPQSLYFSITANGQKGTAVILDSANGRFRYTPQSHIFGVDTFKFRARAGGVKSVDGLFTVTIRPALLTGRILLTDDRAYSVILVDPLNGSQAVISSGDSLKSPRDVVVEPNGEIFVLDGKTGIIKIEPLTGAQTQLAPGTSFTQQPLGPPSMAREHNGNLLVADGTAGIKRIDRVTGAVSVVSSGDSINLAVGVAVDRNGDILAGDASAFFGQPSKIVKINPVTGAQSVLSRGGNLALPVGIAIDDSDRIFVSDAASFAGAPQDYLMRIDKKTGDQTLIDPSETLKVPTGLDVLPNGNLAVANNQSDILAQGGNISQPFGLTVIRSEPLFYSSTQFADFGVVHVGSQAIGSIFVLNSGGAPLYISSIASDSSQFTVSPGSGTIPPSSGEKFYITFRPTSEDSISSRIVFTSDAFDSPFILTVAGRGTLTSVKGTNGSVPLVYALYKNYPNPFNPSTTLRFDLPQASVVTLKVYNILGAEVADLVGGAVHQPGRYAIPFNAARLASGIYFYRLNAQGIDGKRTVFHSVEKMILLR